jgi:hypothetical protein
MINVVSAFAYGCPRAFTDRENHLPTARTVRTKDPPRRAGLCIDVVCIESFLPQRLSAEIDRVGHR